MAVATCEINLKFPGLETAKAEILRMVPPAIAATLQTQRALIFDTEGRHNGRPGWKPLSPRTRPEWGQRQILSKTGVLRRSIAPRTNGIEPGRDVGTIVRYSTGLVVVGTSVPYAAIHNNGGHTGPHIIRPKKAKALRFMGASGEFIFRKSVKHPGSVIPARPFADLTADDVREIEETMANLIMEALK
jgi:phage gpG-like protein